MYTAFEPEDDVDDEESIGGKKKQKRGGNKRDKQSTRKAAEDARDEQVEQFVAQIKDMFDDDGDKDDDDDKKKKKKSQPSNKSPSIDDILSPIRQLLELPTANLKQLTAGAKRQDFRLAWVGSDDAICHVGTGLHKVPLARLQEVFLSFLGRNRIEIQEVIRILGPFPNVKNTLQGASSFGRQEDVFEWRLTWESMLDGTGKEVLAGKEDNVRQVDLQVYFASPSVVVAVVPPETDDVSVRRADPLEESGKHVLLFVREDNLQTQLEKFRVG